MSNSLQFLQSARQVATLLGTTNAEIGRIRTSKATFYRTWREPKKSGGKREFNEPLGRLKEIQRELNKKVLSKVKPHDAAHGYRKGRSILTNVRCHLHKRFVLTLDIKDFYPSVKDSLVCESLVTQGCSRDAAISITRLCCFNRHLPQGTPTSPLLANIVLLRFDERVSNLCRRWNGKMGSRLQLSYTRYADDIAISGNRDFRKYRLAHTIGRIASDYGLSLSHQKEKFMSKSDGQVITRLLLTEDGPKPQQEFYERLEEELLDFRKFGPNAVGAEDVRSAYDHLNGMVNFVKQFDGRKAEDYVVRLKCAMRLHSKK